MGLRRDKTVYCARCQQTGKVTADLERGEVIEATIPTKCIWPQQCVKNFSKGIFERQFGAEIRVPEKFWNG